MKRLAVTVKPSARSESLTEQPDGGWLARITAAPVDGAANEHLIRLLTSHFDVRRSQVRIKSGAASRHKRVEIDD